MTNYHYVFNFPDTGKEHGSVSVAGSFNHWKPENNALSYKADSKSWVGEITTTTPKFTYKYVTDDAGWVVDSKSPIEEDAHGNKNNYGIAKSDDPELDDLAHDVDHIEKDIKSVEGEQEEQTKKEITGLDEEEQFEGDVKGVVNLIDSANAEDERKLKAEIDSEANPGVAAFERDANAVVEGYEEAGKAEREQLKRDALSLEVPEGEDPEEVEADVEGVTKIVDEFDEVNHESHAELQKEFKEPREDDVGIDQMSREINHVVNDIDEVEAELEAHAREDVEQDKANRERRIAIPGPVLVAYHKLFESLKWFIDYYILAFFRH
ncbi:DEKNAAC102122 [Brettanomyces naardenensis]|uniref:DEKNAAC102122 n=1 Tax=Brettanomyces naardenensis TaxID=13370 RepID=A0A448YJZ0_BRENA|nr:DEKNAAC102122 [Brettanomyces naardenensis]